jgi:hypothetical protein
MTFNPGDRVMYEGDPIEFSLSYKAWHGSLGTVMATNNTFPERTLVVWDEDSLFAKDKDNRARKGDHRTHLLRSAELQYDPSQQGDTEEDI